MSRAEPSRSALFVALSSILLATILASPVRAADPHRLALQISDDDPAKMRAVLDIAANVSRYYSGRGEEVEIVVVAFNGGLDLLLEDRSPVRERMANFVKAMPNVSFVACGNTLDALTAKEGRRPPLMAKAMVVKAGVAALLEFSEKKWTIVRP